MGSSKSYRGAPGWEPRNTPGADLKPSKGSPVKAEGTHMSGDGYGRKGLRSSARMKSRSGMTKAKNSGPYGKS